MTDLDALLAAVLANPDDDTPRLIYADCLDDHEASVECPVCRGQCSLPEQEQGTDGVWRRVPCICPRCSGSGRVSNEFAARAEFIRVQVELARLVVRPLAEVMLHPAPVTQQYISECGVLGTLGGSPEGIVAGATVDWVASGVDRADGFWTGVGVVENVGRDGHGLTVRLRPIREDKPDGRNRPARDEERQKARELRRRERELWPLVFRSIIDMPTHAAVFGDDATSFEPTQVSNANAALIVQRGFVSEIRTTLAVWTGGECGRCGGRGWRRLGQLERDGVPPDESADCPACDGTGRTPGIGPRLVAAQPVTRVVTDREPYYLPHGPRWDWWNIDPFRNTDQGPHPASNLPEYLFDLLHGLGTEGDYKTYPSRAAALDALSAALLAWARAA